MCSRVLAEMDFVKILLFLSITLFTCGRVGADDVLLYNLQSFSSENAEAQKNWNNGMDRIIHLSTSGHGVRGIKVGDAPNAIYLKSYVNPRLNDAEKKFCLLKVYGMILSNVWATTGGLKVGARMITPDCGLRYENYEIDLSVGPDNF
jgi:hypothetical protein